MRYRWAIAAAVSLAAGGCASGKKSVAEERMQVSGAATGITNTSANTRVKTEILNLEVLLPGGSSDGDGDPVVWHADKEVIDSHGDITSDSRTESLTVADAVAVERSEQKPAGGGQWRTTAVMAVILVAVVWMALNRRR